MMEHLLAKMHFHLEEMKAGQEQMKNEMKTNQEEMKAGQEQMRARTKTSHMSVEAHIKLLDQQGPQHVIIFQTEQLIELFHYLRFEAFITNKCAKIFFGNQPCQC
jgi:hypothetical protein